MNYKIDLIDQGINKDNLSLYQKILSLIFPIYGVYLYQLNRYNFPKAAKLASKIALWSLIIQFILLLFVIGIKNLNDKQSINLITEPILRENWERIYIQDFGSFDIPPTLEVQSGNYLTYNSESQKRIIKAGSSQIIAQPVGINNSDSEQLNQYSSLIYQTIYGENGDFEELGFDINKYNQLEINKLSETYKNEVNLSFQNTNNKLISWNFLMLKKINKMSCVHYQYVRQLNSNPYVLVNTYIFHNFNRMHMIVLSYRINEAEIWESDFEHIFQTIRINLKL